MVAANTKSQNGSNVDIQLVEFGLDVKLIIDSDMTGTRKVTEVIMNKSRVPLTMDIVIQSVVELEEYEIAALLQRIKIEYGNKCGVCIESGEPSKG